MWRKKKSLKGRLLDMRKWREQKANERSDLLRIADEENAAPFWLWLLVGVLLITTEVLWLLELAA
jgi:hypothetical protein